MGRGVGGEWIHVYVWLSPFACVHAQSLQWCPALCDPMDRSCQVLLSMGILQARILEWVAMPSFPTQGSSWCLTSPALAGGFFTTRATQVHLLFTWNYLNISYTPEQDKKLKKKKTVEKRSFQEKGRILRKPLKLSVMWLEGGRHGYVIEGLVGHGELELNSECIGRHTKVLSEGLASSNLIIYMSPFGCCADWTEKRQKYEWGDQEAAANSW